MQQYICKQIQHIVMFITQLHTHGNFEKGVGLLNNFKQ